MKKAFESVLVIQAVDYNDTFPPSSSLQASEITRRAKSDWNYTLPVTDQVTVGYLSFSISKVTIT